MNITSEWLDRIVEHSEYGRGRIIDVRNAGFEVQVAVSPPIATPLDAS